MANSYRTPLPGEVLTTPYVAVKEDLHGNPGIYSNLCNTTSRADFSDAAIKQKLINNLESMYISARQNEEHLITQFLTQLGDCPLATSLKDEFQAGNYSRIITIMEWYLNNIKMLGATAQENLDLMNTISQIANNDTVRDTYFKMLGYYGSDKRGGPVDPYNFDAELNLDGSFDSFVQLASERLNERIAKNVKELNLDDQKLSDNIILYLKKFVKNLEVLAESLLIEYNQADVITKEFRAPVDGSSVLRSSPRVQYKIATKKMPNDSTSIRQILLDFVVGKINGMSGELAASGIRIGDAATSSAITTNAKTDFIQPLSASGQLEVNWDFADRMYKDALLGEDSLRLNMSKIIDLEKQNEFKDLFFIHGSAKEYIGSTAKLVESTKSGQARLDNLAGIREFLGAQDNTVTEIDQLMFMLVNLMPGAVYEGQVDAINNLLVGVASKWVFDSYAEYLPSSLKFSTNRIDVFGANGKYYAGSDIIRGLINTLNNNNPKTNLVDVGVSATPSSNYYINMPDSIRNEDPWNYVRNQSIANLKFKRFTIKLDALAKISNL